MLAKRRSHDVHRGVGDKACVPIRVAMNELFYLMEKRIRLLLLLLFLLDVLVTLSGKVGYLPTS